MRNVTQTIPVFSWSELSDKVKDATRHEYLEYAAGDWWDHVYNDFSLAAAKLGFDVSHDEIAFSGFCSQGDGASFKGYWEASKLDVDAVFDYAPNDKELHKIAYGFAALVKEHGHGLQCHVSRMPSRYSHDKTIWCHGSWQGCGGDLGPDTDDLLTDYTQRLARWLYAQLEAEHDELLSDDRIAELCRDRGWEFYADGRMFN